MPFQLLIAGSGAETLARALAQEGYACVQARGPLRAQELLDSESIDCIVWSEEAGNPALADDLAATWRAHRHVPLVHLFPAGGGYAGMPPLHARETLPATSEPDALLPVLQRVLEREPAPAQTPGRTELAFRHVVDSLRQHGSFGARQETRAANGPLPPTTTSVNATERAQLATSPASPAESRSPFHWIARRVGRVR